MQTNVIKIKKGRPYYNNFMCCYVVEWTDKKTNVKGAQFFDTYMEGIEFLKCTFPEWFNKNFSKSVK